jgi:hypothetical protein|tara:strand:+ start:61 stop:594 length:534 start_codon:yes stop_codon:yes gene_type:complete
MDPNECYKELYCDGGTLAEYALAQSLKQDLWMWYPHFGSSVFSLDLDQVLSLCPMLETINNIAKIKHAIVTNMTPNDHYKLHIDETAGPRINMLLKSQNSFSAFIDVNNNKTVHMNYQPNKLYIFNTQVPHTIFNFEGDRYLFSIEFEEHKSVLPYRGFVKRLRREEKLTGSLSLIH